ncbi:MAG: hypothetical protein A2V79_09205 [Betaproteobacteria bacterium RBG_16_56_24]|nr:MAG: hypothetical protein A2V79_09205 [Betaproteobacteria bacterium RBG_16_56_24]
MGLKFGNFASSKLVTPPSGTAGLSFVVTPGEGALFPTLAAGDWCYCVLKTASLVREVVRVTARSTDSFTIGTAGRGLDGSSAYASWGVGDVVELCLTNLALLDALADSGRWVAAGGTADAITANYTPDIYALVDGQLCFVRAGAANATATPTFAPDGLTAYTITLDGGAALSPGNIAGAGHELILRYNLANTRWELLNPKTKIGDTIFPVTAELAADAMTLTLKPCVLDFRSPTLTTGVPNTRNVTADVATVISSGSTGGTTSAVASKIMLLAIDNAGTVELAWCNSSLVLDETALISTTAEGGAGAADSAAVIYSTTARSNVPFRVVGYVNSTQTTAGTWAQTPALVQGYGGGVMNAATATTATTATDTASKTGTGSTYVTNTSPTLVTPALGTPISANLSNCTGLPIAGGGTGETTALAAFAALAGAQSIGTSGYAKIGELLVQWGQATSSGTAIGNTTVTFPIAFSAIYAAFGDRISAGYGGQAAPASLSTSGATFTASTGSSGESGILVYWLAIGKI